MRAEGWKFFRMSHLSGWSRWCCIDGVETVMALVLDETEVTPQGEVLPKFTAAYTTPPEDVIPGTKFKIKNPEVYYDELDVVLLKVDILLGRDGWDLEVGQKIN
jgi:hypothetical protein